MYTCINQMYCNFFQQESNEWKRIAVVCMLMIPLCDFYNLDIPFIDLDRNFTE